MKRLTVFFTAILGLGLIAATSPAERLAKDGVWTKPVSEEGDPIIARGEVWSYYVGTGEPRGSWKLGKRGEKWKSGETHIGYNEEGLATLFTTDPAPIKRYPVAYFRKAFVVPLSAHGRNLRLSLDCDDGCIAYVNGVEVGRVRLPAGEIKPFAAGLSDRNWATLTIQKRLIKRGDNVVAVEVHQADPDSSDMRFAAMIHTD